MVIERITCYYANTSSQIQVIRIANVTDWYFERILFPGQRLMFEAPAEAQLEIYANAALINEILCGQLEVRSPETVASPLA
ncbi:MAG: DUF1830 domain-containing protein [Leptolyngbyaceae cyanobacterium SM1_1_3]|nr:DUF1830 domain-containing protein [Leptolyngbyaceae cyanobacterium SM1_1_3]NJM85682.1 DUF1830 domain-containing protein [Leptolyngbyaceae cyanobacterium RM2_2_21]NJN03885.1 DUF1830 domain-containing protein [Leptolyngbyaceae cyanobacterium RM1_1_2]NJO08989.1 DUF1830 domain-containing protein [Leptolyngbyaceae cyanobacterium SL_1_1]